MFATHSCFCLSCIILHLSYYIIGALCLQFSRFLNYSLSIAVINSIQISPVNMNLRRRQRQMLMCLGPQNSVDEEPEEMPPPDAETVQVIPGSELIWKITPRPENSAKVQVYRERKDRSSSVKFRS